MKLVINGQAVATPFTIKAKSVELAWLAERLLELISTFDESRGGEMTWFVDATEELAERMAKIELAKEEWILAEADRIKSQRTQTGFG